MEELKRLAVFGICAALVVRLADGTRYAKHVRFLGQLLLFAQTVGVCVGWAGGSEAVLWERWEQFEREMETTLAGGGAERLQERADGIFEEISGDAAAYWMERQEDAEEGKGDATEAGRGIGDWPCVETSPIEVIIGARGE